MSRKPESKLRNVAVALAVSLVCSIGVSAAAVFLKPLQEANKLADKRKNILQVIGRYEPGIDINAAFEAIETRVIDLSTGEFVDDIDPLSFDMYAAAKDPARSTRLDKSQDIAGIGRRPNYATVYLLRDASGGIESIILPVYGYGLWGTLYGFLALEGDGRTVRGITFYEHKETPGLGGEVDNPRWKSLWPGKQVYGDDGQVALQLVKGHVEPGTPGAEHKVDALAGATLTSKGVSNLIRFWLSDAGYRPFLNRISHG